MNNLSKDLESDSSFNYIFPALRGIQAGREYYTIMCPLKLVPKLFMFEEDERPPIFRAQRTLNKSRVPEIANYILNNDKDYTFSSLTASIDGTVKFNSVGNDNGTYNLGQLIVPMSSKFLINDGQHRRAAIERALVERPDLGSETISIVFFIDAGLKRAQQMFADLNQHSVRPTRSLGILYNYRDKFARFVLSLTESVPIFKGVTEFEKTTLSHRSIKLFTLSSIYQANSALLGKKSKSSKLTETEEKIAFDYWVEVTKHIPEWNLLIAGKVTSGELRKEFIHVHGLGLHALGLAGHCLITEYPNNWKTRLEKLKKVNWSRSNAELWEGRAMVGGRVSKAQTNLILTTNVLKKALGLDLSPEENRIEKKFTKGFFGGV